MNTELEESVLNKIFRTIVKYLFLLVVLGKLSCGAERASESSIETRQRHSFNLPVLCSELGNNEAVKNAQDSKICGQKRIELMDSNIPEVDEEANGNSFIGEYFNNILVGLDEPALSIGAKNTSSNEVYRFLWLRSFHDPVSVRIEKNTTGQYLLTKILLNFSHSTGTADKINMRVSELSDAQWEEISIGIKTMQFWNSPPSMGSFGQDGAFWIFEGAKGDQHHFVIRWSPRLEESNGVFELGYLLLTLAGLSNEELY